MAMKRIIIYILCVIVLAACSDKDFTPNEIWTQDIDELSDAVTVTLTLPLWSDAEVSSRATENVVSGKVVIVANRYDKIPIELIEVVPVTTTEGYKLTFNVPKGTMYLQFIANIDGSTFKPNGILTNPGAIYYNQPISGNIPYWGYAPLSDLLKADYKVELMPMCAKFTVINNATSTFTLQGVKLVGTANGGYVTPKDWNYDATTPLVNASESYSGESDYFLSNPEYCYEAEGGKTTAIIKGEYNGTSYYYKVALCKSGESTPTAILRNHHYQLVINNVKGTGYSSEDEAKAAEVENRIEVEVKDETAAIVNLVSCRDYLLGVSDTISVKYNTTSATASVLTTFNGGNTAPTASSSSSWLTIQSITESSSRPSSETQQSGKVYTLQMAIEANDKSDMERSAIVTVRSGDLERSVTVIQGGSEEIKMQRTIIIINSPKPENASGNNFSYILNNTQGIYPQYMQYVTRYNGLHFQPFNNKVHFTITKIDGDVVHNNDTRFKIMEDGTIWRVYMENLTDETLWTSSFTITNGDKTYYFPVYHTGLIEGISENDPCQPLPTKANGYFYYEIVKVKCKDGSYIHMLDRNLGASCNLFYTPTVTPRSFEEEAQGAYFKIADDNESNLESSIVPEGFEIPTDEDLANLDIKTEVHTTLNGESYYVLYIETVDSMIPRIYLPLTGYYEGESKKNVNHCCLWSKTLLSGTQGFSSGSLEYGYWYRYLDFYGTTQNITNMRFVSGTSGSNSGRYKSMPIRCIRK